MKVHTFPSVTRRSLLRQPSENRGLKVPPTPAYTRLRRPTPTYTRLHPPQGYLWVKFDGGIKSVLCVCINSLMLLRARLTDEDRCHWDLLHVVKMQDEYRGDLLFVLMSVSPAVKQGAAR